jgi:hypothetical protein
MKYAVAKNGVIENIVYTDIAPTPGEGETIVSGNDLPDGADIGWVEIDGVWAHHQAPISSRLDAPLEGPTGPTGPTGSMGTEPTGPTGEGLTGPTGEAPTGPTGDAPIV